MEHGMNERSSIDASRRQYKNTTYLLVPRLHTARVHGPRALANVAQMIRGEQLCPSFEHCAKEVCLHKNSKNIMDQRANDPLT